MHKLSGPLAVYVLNRASKDAVTANRITRETIAGLSSRGYLTKLGPAVRGPKKGQLGYLITEAGEKHLKNLKAGKKETFRFWVSVFASLASGAIVFLLGKFCG